MTDSRITITISGSKGKNYDAKQMREVLNALGVEEPTITEEIADVTETEEAA